MYLIPKNVNTRFEFRDGFGFKELGIMLAGAAVGGCLFFLFGFFDIHLLIRVIVLSLPVLFAFFLIQPHPLTKISVLETFKLAIRYKRSQKRHFYKYGSGQV